MGSTKAMEGGSRMKIFEFISMVLVLYLTVGLMYLNEGTKLPGLFFAMGWIVSTVFTFCLREIYNE